MSFLKRFLILSLCLFSINFDSLASVYVDQENLDPNVDSTQVRRSVRHLESTLKDLDDIYSLEDKLIARFEEFRAEYKKQHGRETRTSLGKCFEQLRELKEFKDNYKLVDLGDGHLFYVPKLIYNLKDDSQFERLASGKAIASPIRRRAFNGHHVQMRDPISVANPTYVWVITTTKHREHSRKLHLSVSKSLVTRSLFAAAQKQLNLKIAEEMGIDIEVLKPKKSKKAINKIALKEVKKNLKHLDEIFR